MSDAPALDRAIAALRAGRTVRVGGLTILSVETGTQAILDLIDPKGNAPLLLSGPRAMALGLGNAHDAAGETAPVEVRHCDWLDREAARALADPSRDFDRGPIGPLNAIPVERPDCAKAALTLARLAGLLPALWLVEDEPVVAIETSAVAEAAYAKSATIVARAKLPIDDLPPSQMVAFRDPASGEEHVALVVGAFGGQPPLVRLHSECLTGDVFGSLKCDCGPQLKEALHIIGASGGGILLYLRQEGRGIGLANKLRAYALQDRGLDTVDANRRLGFADDERGYGMAAAMLRALGIDAVRVLTNNPAKVAGLEREGIRVVERVAHHMPTNPHNADYIATKKKRSGHLD
ncbi:GTP cyclohydrolase II [Sphingomonas sp. NSE70-1]|uniref:GTP cyclohydrolase-2 n=1 Tax=Sphingomonas caseinilyticus TaxID=2908205 RepID=A0ABT0RUW7_9SPHN|nr:GTP cyclohydrolase II [Sphingomonas caseinilyticus]MCL6698784.1 GTP cyclohydrolase II [Sphingomonas caseinilyticus]